MRSHEKSRAPSGLLVAEVAPNEGVVHENHRRRACAIVVLGEVAAAEHGNAQGTEIAGAHRANAHFVQLSGRDRRTALDGESAGPARIERGIEGESRGVDSRRLREPRQDLGLKRAHLVPPGPLGKPLGITRRRKIESHGEDVSGPEAGVYAQEGDEASNEKTRAEDQHHGESDFCHQQAVTNSAGRAAGTRFARSLAQLRAEVEPRSGESGKSSEEERRGEREPEREREHRGVGLDVRGAREVGWGEREKSAP